MSKLNKIYLSITLLALFVCVSPLMLLGVVNGVDLSVYSRYKDKMVMPDSLWIKLLKIKEEAIKSNNFDLLKKTTDFITSNLQTAGDYPGAFTAANEYLHIVSRSSDSTLLANAYYYVGRLYEGLGVSDIALEYFLKMATFNLSDSDKGKAYFSIAESSYNISGARSKESMDYYKQAEGIARKIYDKRLLSKSLVGQSQMLFNLSNRTEYPNKKSMSNGMLDSLRQSTELFESSKNIDPEFFLPYCGLAMNYAMLGNNQKALSNANKALLRVHENPDAIALCYTVLSNTYIIIGNYDKAMEWGLKAYRYAEKTHKKREMRSAANAIYRAAKVKGNFEQALFYFEKSRSAYEEMQLVKREMNLSAMKVRFNIQAKEDMIVHERIEKSKYMTRLANSIVILFITTLSLIICLNLYGNKRRAYKMLIKNTKQWADIKPISIQEQKTVNELDQNQNSADEETVINDTELDDEITETIMKKVADLMLEDRLYVDPNLSLDMLCKKVGTNRSYLSKSINRTTGKNFNTYVNEYRIKEAVRLICESNENHRLNDIALEVGFNNRNSFYLHFKKITGILPSDLKKDMI